MSFRFHCIRERETDNAVLVTEIEGDESIWIPLSQVESMHFDAKGNGEIVVTDWIARQKGLT